MNFHDLKRNTNINEVGMSSSFSKVGVSNINKSEYVKPYLAQANTEYGYSSRLSSSSSFLGSSVSKILSLGLGQKPKYKRNGQEFRVNKGRVNTNSGFRALLYRDIQDLKKQSDVVQIDLDNRIKDLAKELEELKITYADVKAHRSKSDLVDGAISIDSTKFISLDDIERCQLPLKDLDYESLFSQVRLDKLYSLEIDPLAVYARLVQKFESIEGTKRLIKVISKQINFLVSLIKKRLRNLRQVFTKLHSFHFKNLDDYHSTDLNLSF